MMSVKKIFLIIFCLFLCLNYGFCDEFNLLEPVEKSQRQDRKSFVMIDCNIPNCEVYLNDLYQGETKLEIDDLFASEYELVVRKEGFSDLRCLIQIKQGYNYKFFVELNVLTGFIEITDFFDDSEVYIGSKKVSENHVEVSVGEKIVTLKRFGFEDYVESVKVDENKTAYISPLWVESPFKLYDFKVSAGKINFEDEARFLGCEVSFKVTNNGKAKVSVADENGNEIWSYSFEFFYKKEQSVIWDGRKNDGQLPENGVYFVRLISEGFTEEKKVTVVREKNAPVYVVTKSGMGCANEMVAFISEENVFEIGVMTEPWVEMNNSGSKFEAGFYALNGSLSCLACLSNGLEFSGILDCYFNQKENTVPLRFNISTKYNFKLNFRNGVELENAVLLRYGYSNVDLFNSYGIDYGNGLGAGYTAGLKFANSYLGGFLKVIVGAENGDLSSDRNLFTFGNVYCYSFGGKVNLAASIDVQNEFSKKDFFFFHALSVSLDSIIKPAATPVAFEAGLNGIIFVNSPSVGENYFSLKIGLSYFF